MAENPRPGAPPIRVLHLIDSLVAGGKERQFIELLKGLKNTPGVTCAGVIFSDVIEYEGFAELGVPFWLLTRNTRYDPGVYGRLHAIMREFRPQIVHSWNGMCSVYGAPLARLCGARFVNGFVRAAPPGLSLRDPDYVRGLLTMPFSDVVVANSAAGLSAYRIPANKGVFIHNGFDRKRLEGLSEPRALRRALAIETPYIVGMIASYSRWKDYDSFFAAAREITAARNDVTFVAVGDGPNFSRYQAALPPERFPAIRLLGRRQDVESIANLFAVGVLLSTQGEGIANAIAECMALGKPVVATDCDGNSELIVESETGYLIPRGDAAALVRRICQLLDDPALAARMGEGGKRRIHESFGLEKMVQSYARLYDDLLGRHWPQPVRSQP